MAQSDGSVIIDIDLDDKDFDQKLKENEKKTKNFGSKIKSVIAGLGIAKITNDFISAGVNYNIAIQNYTAGLTTLLGSAEKAESMIADLKAYAASTPFELSDLTSATQTLLSFGVAEKDVMATMKMMGDISLGNKDKFQSLALVFGQVSSQGKLMGQDLLQMINAGFNPLQVISNKTGESMASLKDKMSQGKIGIEEVTKAFQWATEEGGTFYGGMERGSQTLSGQISTLKDNFNSFAGEAVKPLVDLMSTTIVPALNTIFSNSEMLIGVLNTLLPILIAIGAAYAAWQVVLFIQGLPAMLSALKTSILGVNAAMSANPVAAVIAVITALAAAFIYLWNTSEEFRRFWIDLWNTVVQFVTDAFNSVQDFFTKTIPNMVKNVTNWFSTMYNNIVNYIKSIPGKISTYLSNTISKVVSFASSMASKGKQAASNLYNAIVNGIKSLPSQMMNIGKNIVQGLWNGISNVKDWILGKISGFVDGIVGGIKDFFGIHSPSTLMRDAIGKFLPPGIAVGFELAMPKTIGNINDDIDRMTNEMQRKIDMNMNDIETSARLENNVSINRNSDITGAFPKSVRMDGNQNVYLVTADGTELAHWFAPFIDKELKFD